VTKRKNEQVHPMWNRTSLAASLGAALLSLATTAFADSRALLIGIGDYEMKDADLPGIDLDIATMKRVASTMGFKDNEVKVLFDGAATYDGVVRELATWARSGVTNKDKVLIYFSGHGTRIPDANNDEPDGADEVLVLRDSRPARVNGRATFEKVLIDDKMAELLAQIPTSNLLVLIDACNSGTATRTLELKNRRLGNSSVAVKYLDYPGMPRGDGFTLKNEASAKSNFAALAAAQDNEYALATAEGGIFTIGLARSIHEAATKKVDLSLAELRNEVASYIAQNTDDRNRYTPVTTGRKDLIEGDLDLIPLAGGNGPVWREQIALAQRGKPMQTTSARTTYEVGAEMSFTVQVPVEGYLNVVTVDAQDRTTVLFPNSFTKDNKVKPGAFSFPLETMDFQLRASEPLGPSLVVAYLTEQPVSFYELGVEGRDSQGVMQSALTSLSNQATRAITVEARRRFHAGQVQVTVVRAAGKAPSSSPTQWVTPAEVASELETRAANEKRGLSLQQFLQEKERAVEPDAPTISILKPTVGQPIAPPVDIEVGFQAAGGARIDVTSLRIRYGMLGIDITERIRNSGAVSITPEGLTAHGAELPGGTHVLTIEIADDQHRRARQRVRFTIQS
jgi:metacaspase-1